MPLLWRFFHAFGFLRIGCEVCVFRAKSLRQKQRFTMPMQNDTPACLSARARFLLCYVFFTRRSLFEATLCHFQSCFQCSSSSVRDISAINLTLTCGSVRTCVCVRVSCHFTLRLAAFKWISAALAVVTRCLSNVFVPAGRRRYLLRLTGEIGSCRLPGAGCVPLEGRAGRHAVRQSCVWFLSPRVFPRPGFSVVQIRRVFEWRQGGRR